jgi:hypothetical protein
MIQRDITPEQRCFANIGAWARHHGLEVSNCIRMEQDRCWYEDTWTMRADVERLARNKVLIAGNYKNHGETAVAGWREARGRCSAQVIDHGDRWEIDFDFWNPWDLVGLVGHGWEVITNKLGKRKTDPVKVTEALRKRGIHVRW